MPAFTPDYQIAAGANNTAGLTPVNQLTDANGVTFFMPRALPYHEFGQLQIESNGTPDYRGFDSQDWEFKALLVAQYHLLRTTYTGLVTVRTSLDDGQSFANYNARAWIDQKTAAQYRYAVGNVWYPSATGPTLTPVRLHLIRLEAL
jgi:hypothetical protein